MKRGNFLKIYNFLIVSGIVQDSDPDKVANSIRCNQIVTAFRLRHNTKSFH